MSKDLDSNVPVGHFMDSADAEIARLTAALAGKEAELTGAIARSARAHGELERAEAALEVRDEQLAQVREALARWAALAAHLSECEACTDGDGCEYAFLEMADCRDQGLAALATTTPSPTP